MISVVIPAYNEAESVGELHEELLTVLTKTREKFEIIFIDDGSTDNTLAELHKLSPVRVISFARNFGKSQALMAGFAAAAGDMIFTLDSDLQDDPAEIPKFLARFKESKTDLVCGWKVNRRDSAAKRFVSKIANSVTAYFTSARVHDMNCCYKLFRTEVAKSLHLYGDMHRYIPALAATAGYKISEVPVHHRARKFGVSKYGNFRRFFKSFFDFITLILLSRFAHRPMHLFGIAGFILSAAGVLILAYMSYLRLFLDEFIGNRPLLMLGVLLLVVGIQSFTSGFLGELLIREKRERPAFTVKEDVSKL
ncbi:MAG TPA: glycosyltransferase family 2 protein [Candidatus Paceibacterota bacterium]